MPFNQYKTQVLLLHSQQDALDALSTGFSDRYSVHVATSGAEALHTLGDTPIHVIVSAQDLPGMSGLDAIREARKRSPETIGILLAGRNPQDGLEALVGDQEVFQVVRGEIAPNALVDLVESAAQRIRMLTISESANDQAANVDHPSGENIVMETMDDGTAVVAFLIGGANGHGAPALARADLVLSLGPMTWPHLLVRAMLAEQLWRAASILSGHPYHRG